MKKKKDDRTLNELTEMDYQFSNTKKVKWWERIFTLGVTHLRNGKRIILAGWFAINAVTVLLIW